MGRDFSLCFGHPDAGLNAVEQVGGWPRVVERRIWVRHRFSFYKSLRCRESHLFARAFIAGVDPSLVAGGPGRRNNGLASFHVRGHTVTVSHREAGCVHRVSRDFERAHIFFVAGWPVTCLIRGISSNILRARHVHCVSLFSVPANLRRGTHLVPSLLSVNIGVVVELVDIDARHVILALV